MIISKKTNYDVIISLTTWKGRIEDPALPRVLFRLLSQKTNYSYKVVLVLSSDEFGDNYKLPDDLNILDSEIENFEILWTKRNTKALKKLNPTMEKYSNLPIITLDDDILVSKNLVEIFMKAHEANPDDIIGTHVFTANDVLIACGVRLFPANSLENISDDIFEKYFHLLQDDEFNGIRARMKKTKIIKLKNNIDDDIIENMSFGRQDVAMYKQHFKIKPDIKQLYKDYPEMAAL